MLIHLFKTDECLKECCIIVNCEGMALIDIKCPLDKYCNGLRHPEYKQLVLKELQDICTEEELFEILI